MGVMSTAPNREDYRKAREELESLLIESWKSMALGTYSEGPLPGPENIVGIGIGEKYKDNEPIGEKSLNIFVVKKLPRERIDDEFYISTHLYGVPTDVQETGELTKYSHRDCYRPLRGGISIGRADENSVGTLGFFVKDKKSVRHLLLSNNHVLAKENAGSQGDAILQPGRPDGGTDPADRVARLDRFERIDFSGGPNLVDAALADLLPVNWRRNIEGIGTILGKMSPSPGMKVKKSGRTSQVTQGQVIAIDATVRVYYDGKTAIFKEAIVIGPEGFSNRGDSGSIILSDDNRACGLLFAGSERFKVTLANPIEHVEKLLNVEAV